jgi:hypothetical protein
MSIRQGVGVVMFLLCAVTSFVWANGSGDRSHTRLLNNRELAEEARGGTPDCPWDVVSAPCSDQTPCYTRTAAECVSSEQPNSCLRCTTEANTGNCLNNSSAGFRGFSSCRTTTVVDGCGNAYSGSRCRYNDSTMACTCFAGIISPGSQCARVTVTTTPCQ